MRRIAIMMAVALILTLCAAQGMAGEQRELTLADVHALAAQGEALTLADLSGYRGEPIGSDPVLMRYPLDGGQALVVCAVEPDAPVLFARLFLSGLDEADERLGVDIRAGDIDAYLLSDPAAPLVESYLNRISCPGACTYVIAIINLHPQDRDALLALDFRALPALTAELLSGERGLRGSMAEVFTDEILSRRAQRGGAALEAEPIEQAARDALESYNGQPFKPHAPNPDWGQ